MFGGEGGVRAQSETLGVVLLLGITIFGATAVVTLGSTAVSDSKDTVQLGSAENAMMQLDSRASLVAHGESDRQSTTLVGGSGTTRVDETAGWMNVSVYNETTGKHRVTIMNRTMGVVEYEDGLTSLAYQGGGVWKRTSHGASMLSPPEFHYRNSTLTLPLVVVRGSSTVDGRVFLEETTATTTTYPDPGGANDWTNPLSEGKVNVTVHSRYAEAWGRFFEQRTDGSVTYLDDETVVLSLTTLANSPSVASALTSTSPTGSIELTGTGAYTDSYNSSGTGVYANTSTDGGTIVTAGNFTVSGNGEVKGTVRAGGAVKIKDSAASLDDVEYTTEFDAHAGSTYGAVTRITGVESTSARDAFVDNWVGRIQSGNDNGATTAIQGDQLDITGGSATIGAGTYYLTDLTLGDDLVLDTTGGNIEIAVRDYVDVDGGHLKVKGDGTVRIYVKGENPYSTGGDDFHLFLKNGEMTVPHDDSRQLWVYGESDFNATLQQSTFVGVVYAPAGEDGTGSLVVSQSDLYGGAVTGDTTLDQYGAIHYDEVLRTAKPLPPEANVIRLTYLHVSYTNVTVSN